MLAKLLAASGNADPAPTAHTHTGVVPRGGGGLRAAGAAAEAAAAQVAHAAQAAEVAAAAGGAAGGEVSVSTIGGVAVGALPPPQPSQRGARASWEGGGVAKSFKRLTGMLMSGGGGAPGGGGAAAGPSSEDGAAGGNGSSGDPGRVRQLMHRMRSTKRRSDGFFEASGGGTDSGGVARGLESADGAELPLPALLVQSPSRAHGMLTAPPHAAHGLPPRAPHSGRVSGHGSAAGEAAAGGDGAASSLSGQVASADAPPLADLAEAVLGRHPSRRSALGTGPAAAAAATAAASSRGSVGQREAA
jgi:hypothetical protein